MLTRLADELPERDRAALEVIGAHRYLTTHQIQRFVCIGHTSDQSAARTARALTRRLSEQGLLRPMERRIGGLHPGSAATVWQLAPAGHKLLRREGSGYRTHLPSPRFLSHCLAVADVHLGIRTLPGQAGITAVHTETEPTCWRRYSGQGGEPRWLQPDLFASISTAAYDDHWFVEVDLGTESLPTLLSKCRQYEAYRATGIEQDRLGAFPVVLWVLLREQRIEPLRAALVRSSTLDPALHHLVRPSEVRQVLEQGA